MNITPKTALKASSSHLVSQNWVRIDIIHAVIMVQWIRITKPTVRTKTEVYSASAIIRAVTDNNSHENITAILEYVMGILFGNEILSDLLYDTSDHDIDINELHILAI